MRKARPAALLPAALVSLVLFAALDGCATTPSLRIPVVGADYRVPPDFRIVGYFPSWSGQSADIQFEALTHINYAFLSPDRYGAYQPVPGPRSCVSLSRWHMRTA